MSNNTGTGPSHKLGASNFFAKMKDNYSSKFSSLSISSSSYEKDGNCEDETLIHNAFVKYFDKNNQAYPEWLGVVKTPQNQQYSRRAPSQTQYAQGQYDNLELQPVGQNNSFNNSYNQQHQHQHQQLQPQNQNYLQLSFDPAETLNLAPHPQQKITYQSRTSSRLQDMHNKSRQQAIPGQGYNSQMVQPSRNNGTSVSGSRLRERMLNSSHTSNNQQEGAPPQSSQNSAPRATWGKRSQ